MKIFIEKLMKFDLQDFKDSFIIAKKQYSEMRGYL